MKCHQYGNLQLMSQQQICALFIDCCCVYVHFPSCSHLQSHLSCLDTQPHILFMGGGIKIDGFYYANSSSGMAAVGFNFFFQSILSHCSQLCIDQGGIWVRGPHHNLHHLMCCLCYLPYFVFCNWPHHDWDLLAATSSISKNKLWCLDIQNFFGWAHHDWLVLELYWQHLVVIIFVIEFLEYICSIDLQNCIKMENHRKNCPSISQWEEATLNQ